MLPLLQSLPLRRNFLTLALIAACFAPAARAEDLPESAPAPAPVLSLGECINLAREKSPVIKAAGASLLAAETSQQGVEKAARFTHRIITPDIDYRKRQAANGVAAAQAECMQAEYDVTYNVIRTYYSAVYAREQMSVTRKVLANFDLDLATVKGALDAGTQGITRDMLNQIEIYKGQVASRQIEAESGFERALKALAHEMGSPDLRFGIGERALPEMQSDNVTREAVVQQALGRRGELTLASIGAEVLRLEVDAQGAIRFRLRSFTAAVGSDIHARPVPQGSREGEYRPDALAPSFPAMLVGDRKARVATAEALAMRGDAVYEKTRDLVTLEAENGFLRLKETAKRVAELRIARNSAEQMRDRYRNDPERKFSSTVTQNEVLAAQTIATYNEAVYQHLAALASLERITAGGVRVNFPGR